MKTGRCELMTTRSVFETGRSIESGARSSFGVHTPIMGSGWPNEMNLRRMKLAGTHSATRSITCWMVRESVPVFIMRFSRLLKGSRGLENERDEHNSKPYEDKTV